MRLPSILALTFLTAISLPAQSIPEPSTYASIPSPELILQWLHSPDPRLQAWAAHDILTNHDTTLIPALQSQLERTTPATLTDAARLANFRTTYAILDTLIQLDATVPAATLSWIDKLGYNAQPEELVLLSRLPWDEAEPAIHSFYKPGESSHPAETRVAAQMLAQHPPKGFAAELLASILVTAHIWVHDADNPFGMGSGASSCCGAGSGDITDDWPEIGRYSFQDPPRGEEKLPRNATLFLSPPDPIYLVRTVGRKYYPNPPCGAFAPLNDAIRSHLAGTLLSGNPASPFPEQPVFLNIPFRSRESYRAEVQAFVDEQQQNFNQIATTLTALNHLTEKERQAATLRIHLSLQDLRKQPVQDLPPLTFRPPIQWVPAF